MVNKPIWLSMRHFVTSEYLQGIYMGQKPYKICSTNLITNGLIEPLTECTIFASSLMRSKQTVDYICNSFPKIQFDVIYSDCLIERGLGDFEGERKCYIKKNKDFFVDGKYKVELTPPNGEPFISFKNRVESILKIICKKYHTNNILIISHLQVLRMIKYCMSEEENYLHWHDINYNHGEIVKESYGKK